VVLNFAYSFLNGKYVAENNVTELKKKKVYLSLYIWKIG